MANSAWISARLAKGPLVESSTSAGAARSRSRISELALDDLAGRGQRERVDELHEAWGLVARELRLTPGDELVLGGGVAGLLDDDRLDLLAVRLVRDADDRDHGDGRVLHEHLLELAGVHVEAAADDHVLGAIDDVVVAVL